MHKQGNDEYSKTNVYFLYFHVGIWIIVIFELSNEKLKEYS